MIISEVCDHQTNYKAKFIEITNASMESQNIKDWEIRRYSNGSSTGYSLVFGDITLASGESLVATYSAAEFKVVFGDLSPNLVGSTQISGNGDDVYELFDTVQVVDIYGEVGVNGSGTAWDYLDAVAKRLPPVVTGTTVWDANEWVITSGDGDANPFDRN